MSTRSDATPGCVPPVRLEPTDDEAWRLMQQGRWPEAEAALAALEADVARAPERAEIREALALHRSVEDAWAEARRQRWRALLRGPVLKGLAIANVVLYVTLGILRLA